MQFVPEEVWYQRLRQTINALHRLGCEGNVLFECATQFGMTTDMFDLAASAAGDDALNEDLDRLGVPRV